MSPVSAVNYHLTPGTYTYIERPGSAKFASGLQPTAANGKRRGG